MQYVNDDMDDLFRRAAQDYPLNTRGADWDKLQKALEEPPAPNGAPARKDNRRHLLWLLLLLPLPWICTRYIDEGDKDLAHAPAVQKATEASSEKSIPDVVPQERPGTTVKSSFEGPVDLLGPLSSPGNTKSHTAMNRAVIGDNSILNESRRQGAPMDDSERELPALRSDEQQRTAEALKQPAAASGKSGEAPDSTRIKQDTSVAEPPVKKVQQLLKAKRFYAGMIGGADITSIEGQRVKKIGYDLGVVAGYSINDRWSVEGGLLSSEKAYYSSGEHLYKAYTLPGTKLREAEGDCRMWEVPLVVRYRFAPHKQGGWFASVGTSSYFMKKESYDYTYYYTATGQEVKRSRSYDSDSRHLFAAAQVSGGYTRRVGRSMDIRIEPYLKLPLRKVGYYELPLTSFGVHAGITRKLY